MDMTEQRYGDHERHRLDVRTGGAETGAPA